MSSLFISCYDINDEPLPRSPANLLNALADFRYSFAHVPPLQRASRPRKPICIPSNISSCCKSPERPTDTTSPSPTPPSVSGSAITPSSSSADRSAPKAFSPAPNTPRPPPRHPPITAKGRDSSTPSPNPTPANSANSAPRLIRISQHLEPCKPLQQQDAQ